MARPKRKRTRTSAFGSAGRSSHDATRFYQSRLYEQAGSPGKISYVENEIEPQYLNRIFCQSSEVMAELPAASVHLMVTSPPYNVGKEYDQDLSLTEYRELLRRVWAETYRVLVPGGRACINVANLGRRPYIPLHCYLIQDLLDLGFLMRGEILWDKGNSAAASTAWGSFLQATNPVLRDSHEYILVFCKESFTRPNPHRRPSTISREEFLEYTKSVWRFPAAQASRIGHPAPFPLELPYRLIQLYTFAGEVVLDPFAGSGTTCLAALKTGRKFVAYEIEARYCELAYQRLRALTLEESTEPVLAK